MKVGFVTIGQSPRTDILSDIAPLLSGIAIVESGALDFVDPMDLPRMTPEGQPGDIPLVTRLHDGTPIILSKRKVDPLLQRAVELVVAQGVSMVVVLCTGEFNHLHVPVPILFPDRLLTYFVQAVLPKDARLGVLVPLADQISFAQTRWGVICPDTHVMSLSPYSGFEQEVEAVRDLAGRTLVVLDCLGYSQRHKTAIQERTGAPAVLARTLIARTIQELMLSA